MRKMVGKAEECEKEEVEVTKIRVKERGGKGGGESRRTEGKQQEKKARLKRDGNEINDNVSTRIEKWKRNRRRRRKERRSRSRGRQGQIWAT